MTSVEEMSPAGTQEPRSTDEGFLYFSGRHRGKLAGASEITLGDIAGSSAAMAGAPRREPRKLTSLGERRHFLYFRKLLQK